MFTKRGNMSLMCFFFLVLLLCFLMRSLVFMGHRTLHLFWFKKYYSGILRVKRKQFPSLLYLVINITSNMN